MNELLLPTSYLPPISYLAHLVNRSSATVEVRETFPKQTHRNRCEILTSNGIMRLSVPVVRTNGNHTLTQDIAISYAERWNIQHIRAIESAYNTSPYFLYLWDPLKAILLGCHERLIDLNTKLMNYLLSKLSIECEISYSEEYHNEQPSPDSDQWLDLRDMFAHNNINTPVTQPSNPSTINIPTPKPTQSPTFKPQLSTFNFQKYYQVWSDRHGFCPNLSILDLLFNIGPAESHNYLKSLSEQA